MSGGSSRRYPPELRERAVRMVAEISPKFPLVGWRFAWLTWAFVVWY